ncbi:MAG: HAD family hydrolase [Candidatus Bathyarchaeia archaeon]
MENSNRSAYLSQEAHMSRLSGIKAVLFDLFDTLLLIKDSNISENCLKNIHRFLVSNGVNVSYEDFMRAYSDVRKSLYDRISKRLEEPHFKIRITDTLRRLGYNCNIEAPIVKGATEAYSEEFARHVYSDEEAHHTLCRLRERGYKIGVISNFAIPECAHKLISDYGLKDLLDVTVISAEVNRRKPSPEIYNFALGLLGINAEEAVFVGDTPDIDIRGAKAVGMKTILILRREMEISAEDKPDFVIKRLSDLLNLLCG